jgi:hypothetical protein
MTDETKYVLVPREPTREMWGDDLVRWLIRWCGYDRPTPKALLTDLKLGYGPAPLWLEAEAEMQDQDHVVSKGTRAVFIYRAMLSASPAIASGEDVALEALRRIELVEDDFSDSGHGSAKFLMKKIAQAALAAMAQKPESIKPRI